MPKKISELPATGKVSDSDLLEASRDPHGAGDSVHMPIGMLRLFMADPAGDWRDSVRFRTIGNVDLATGLADGSTHDGVTGATGDRALVPDQTDATENGVYELQASGAAVRVADFDADAEVLNGAIFYVRKGTVHKGTAWIVTSADPHVVGTDDITFAAHAPALGGSVAVHEAGTPVVSAATILNMLSSTVVDAGGGQANITPTGGSGGGGGGAGGGLVEIASKDFGAGSATEWDVDVTGYDQVFIYASDTPAMLVRTSTDGTNFADTSGDYRRAFVNDATNNTSSTILGFQITDESADTSQVFAIASLSNLASDAIETMWLMHGFNDGTSGFAAIVEGFRNAKEVNTHIRFVNNAGGSIAAGVVRVMGVAAGGGQAAGGGGGVLEYLGRLTFAGEFSQTFNLSDLGTDEILEIYADNMHVDTDDTTFYLRAAPGGSVDSGSNYNYAMYSLEASSPLDDGGATDKFMFGPALAGKRIGNEANEYGTASATLWGLRDSSRWSHCQADATNPGAGGSATRSISASLYKVLNDVDQIAVEASSGATIDSGTVYFYKRKVADDGGGALWSQTFTAATEIEVKDLPTLDANKSYELRLRNVATSVDGAEIRLEKSDDNGANYKSAALYGWQVDAKAANGGTEVDFGNLVTIANLTPNDAGWTMGNAAGEELNMDISLYGMNDASSFNVFQTKGTYYTNTGISVHFSGSAAYDEAFICDAIRIKPASGTFSGYAELVEV